MTKKEQIAKAKIEAVEKDFRERKEHRDSMTEEESVPPIDGMQVYKNELKKLEVAENKEIPKMNLNSAPIHAKVYDKRENSKTTKNESKRIVEETEK